MATIRVSAKIAANHHLFLKTAARESGIKLDSITDYVIEAGLEHLKKNGFTRSFDKTVINAAVLTDRENELYKLVNAKPIVFSGASIRHQAAEVARQGKFKYQAWKQSQVEIHQNTNIKQAFGEIEAEMMMIAEKNTPKEPVSDAT